MNEVNVKSKFMKYHKLESSHMYSLAKGMIIEDAIPTIRVNGIEIWSYKIENERSHPNNVIHEP